MCAPNPTLGGQGQAPTRAQRIRWLKNDIEEAERDLIEWHRQLKELEGQCNCMACKPKVDNG